MSTHRILAGLATPALLLIASCKNEDSNPDTGGNESSSGGGSNATKVLRFSAIPDQNVSEQPAKYKGIADYLAEALDIEVEFVPSADYPASVTMFENGEIQLAWFGGLSGVQARNTVAGARAIAQGAEDPKYFSYFIANADTGLEPSDEFPTAIKDLKFTFGSKGSTSGRLMPTFFIQQNTDTLPDDWFSNPVNYSGAHDVTAELVEAGDQWQAGALSYTTYDKMVAEGKLDPEKCVAIWKTPFYADYNWTAHPDLEEAFGEGFIDKLQKALVDLKDPALLGVLQRTAMIPASNADFEGIEKVAKALDMLN